MDSGESRSRALVPMRRRTLALPGRARSRRRFAGAALAAFGAISAAVQFVGQLFPRALAEAAPITAVAVGVCVVWGLLRLRHRGRLVHEFRHPRTTVVIAPGDLLEQQSHLVVGFSDTFDTVTGDGPVSEASLQGQLLERRYRGDFARLDAELAAALRRTAPISRERRGDKRLGKLRRYPVGTVAVLGRRPHLVFAVACSRIGNDYVARSSAEELGESLHRLWDAVQRHGELEPVAMPLLGSGLSRLDHLDAEALIRLILLTFVLRSRERLVCRELRLVLRPREFARLDLPELAAFLGALESGRSPGQVPGPRR